MKKISLFVICFLFAFIKKEPIIHDNFYTIVSKTEAEIAKNESYLSKKEQKEYFRFKWFWKNRIDANGAFKTYANSYLKSGNLLADIPQGKNKNHWELVGPQVFPQNKFNLSDRDRLLGVGHLKSVFVYPDDKNHILIGAQAGGLWETKNGGENWHCLTNDIPAMTVKNIEVVNGVIYAGTGYIHTGKRFSNNINQQDYGLGVIRSYDNGKTWQWDKNTLFNCLGFSIHQNNPEIIYAVSNLHAYKSINGGKSWEKQKVNSQNSMLDGIEVHPENPDIAFAYSFFNFNKKQNVKSIVLHKTENGGKNWIPKNIDLQNATKKQPLEINGVKNGLKLFYNKEDETLYASLLTNGYAKRNNQLLVFKSKNWNDFTLLNESTSYGGHMLSNSFLTHKNDIYFGGVYLYHANNKELKFKNISRKIHVDIRDLAWHSGTLFVATDGGLFSTQNNGKTWKNRSGNLNVVQAYSMSYTNSNNKKTITVGTQDDGYYRYDFDGKPWYNIEPWGEGCNFVSPKNDQIIFTKNNNGYVYRSKNGGKRNNILRSEGKNIRYLESENPIIFHPKKENTILTELISFGKDNRHGLFISDDLGDTWRLLRGNNHGERILAIEQCKTKPENIFMSTVVYDYSKNPLTYVSKIYKSTDAGKTFTEITNNLTLPAEHARINDIAVHPKNPKKIWICFGNLNANEKVYYSKNGGKTWRNISHNFPNFPVNRIVYNYKKCDVLIGTDIGVFIKERKRWKRYGKNLPNAMVTDMAIDERTQELFIGTYGRGVWKVDM